MCRLNVPKPRQGRASRSPAPALAAVSDLPDLLAPLTKQVVLGAVPEGMRRATSQQEFTRAVKEHGDALALRCHGYRNLMLVATKLSDWADWTTLTTRPTEQRIADDTDLALSTVKRWVRWLRERGFLGTVEEGTTVRFRKGTRCGLDDDGLGNRAAVWVLCVPAPELDEEHARTDTLTDKTTTEPPSCTSRRGVHEGPTRARERSSSRRRNRISTTDGPAATPGTRKHALQIAQKLHDTDPVVARLSPWYIRHLTRDFVAAGWSADDVQHALNHHPDGTEWTYTWTSRDQIRNVPGWVRFRLSAWLDDGRPVPGKSQRLAAAAAELRAQQEAWRREREEQRARAGLDPIQREPVLSRAEALAPPPVQAAAPAAPSESYRSVRAEMERKRREREALQLAEMRRLGA
ncbi:hypothetical protein ACQP1V_42905 (plasmid) [Microtetraspora malaysiensis]|uniref:hypothetical protein n=1 Tax=Microtetraspora malaysiensis TaxID=161358 RepID=UPI003D91AADD